MSRLRFVIQYGPASLDPARMGWVAARSGANPALDVPVVPAGDDRPRSDGRMVRMPPTAAIRSHSNRMLGRRNVGDDGWFAWRLIGANNRELGRSVASFANYQSCVVAVAELRERLDDLDANAFANARSGRWGWQINIGDEAVAACGHWYEREREARVSLANFITAAERAEVAEGVVTLRHYGASTSGSAIAGAMC